MYPPTVYFSTKQVLRKPFCTVNSYPQAAYFQIAFPACQPTFLPPPVLPISLTRISPLLFSPFISSHFFVYLRFAFRHLPSPVFPLALPPWLLIPNRSSDHFLGLNLHHFLISVCRDSHSHFLSIYFSH